MDSQKSKTALAKVIARAVVRSKSAYDLLNMLSML